MKVSLITVCLNSRSTIEDAFKSVATQTYQNIEYIVVDGNSVDGTKEIIERYRSIISLYISEEDKGLYDAINKGILNSSGDIIGILNSDDLLYDDSVIENIVGCFDNNIDGVFGNVVFCRRDSLPTLTRFYSSISFSKKKLKRGIMPAHPSLYIRRKCFDEIGMYSLDYKIAADFDFVTRLFQCDRYNIFYVNKIIVKMREGGVSTSGLKSKILLNKETLLSLKRNGVSSNWFLLLSKYPMKLLGVLRAKFIPRR